MTFENIVLFMGVGFVIGWLCCEAYVWFKA